MLKDDTLWYFRERDSNEPAGSILMTKALVRELGNKKYSFEIATPERKYSIKAESSAEMAGWMDALKMAALKTGPSANTGGARRKNSVAAHVPAGLKADSVSVWIAGVMCDRCEQRVRNVIAKVQGVHSFEFNPHDEIAVVKGKVDVAELFSMLEDAGFFPATV